MHIVGEVLHPIFASRAPIPCCGPVSRHGVRPCAETCSTWARTRTCPVADLPCSISGLAALDLSVDADSSGPGRELGLDFFGTGTPDQPRRPRRMASHQQVIHRSLSCRGGVADIVTAHQFCAGGHVHMVSCSRSGTCHALVQTTPRARRGFFFLLAAHRGLVGPAPGSAPP